MPNKRLSSKIGSSFLFFKNNKDKKISVPDGFFRIKKASVLMASHDNQKLFNSITSLIGLSETIFDSYYLPVINNYAEFVQELPASRGHHHAQQGGLLTHTLEVVYYGLKRKASYIIPPNTPPENVSEVEQRWIYGIFLSCMLHDIGKTSSDMLCQVFDADFKSVGRWGPFMGSMTALKSKPSYYNIKFPTKSKYSYHGELTLLLISRIVPSQILDWLQRDNELFQVLLSSLNGQFVENNIIKDIVKFADSESTKRNIGATGSVDMNRIDQGYVSLSDKILSTVKYLINDTKDLQFNKPGAIGFIYQSYIYFVSKKFVDLLRDSMTRQGIKGVPGSNTRMLDIMQEHGIIIESARKKAIWQTMVQLTDDDWEQALSMVKVPISILSLPSDDVPKQMIGRLLFEPRDITSQQDVKNAGNKVDIDKSVLIENKSKANAVTENKEIIDKKVADECKADAVNTKSGDDKIVVPNKSPVIVQSEIVISTKSNRSDKEKLGDLFVQWLRNSITNKTIKYNSTGAMLHVVSNEKMLLLVSPKIFKHLLLDKSVTEQLAELGIVDSDGTKGLTKLQKGFFALKHHTLNPSNQRMVTPVIVTGGPSNKISQLNGVVVADWSLFFASEPPKNPKLSFLEE